MNKKLVVPFIFVVLILGITFISAAECNDSDGGINFYEKGSAIQFSGDEDYSTDFCEDEFQLREYSCKVSSSGIKSTVYTCPEGCEDGACKGKEIPLGENECFDTDQLIDLYEKGHVIDKPHNADYFDFCLDADSIEDFLQNGGNISENGKIIREHYCGVNNYQYAYYECYNGCIDGACVEVDINTSIEGITCVDSDAKYPVMVNFFEKGFVNNTNGLYTPGFYEDYCEGDTVTDYICDLSGALEVKYDCPYGCKNGACIEFEIISPGKLGRPIKIAEEDKKDQYLCDGCELENRCYPYGYRKSGKFCFIENNQFVEQKQAESPCDNDFECSSNLCISGECISQNLLQKIINWLKGIF
jgi:hypothetical protein